jgi:hypothetical protein
MVKRVAKPDGPWDVIQPERIDDPCGKIAESLAPVLQVKNCKQIRRPFAYYYASLIVGLAPRSRLQKREKFGDARWAPSVRRNHFIAKQLTSDCNHVLYRTPTPLVSNGVYDQQVISSTQGESNG